MDRTRNNVLNADEADYGNGIDVRGDLGEGEHSEEDENCRTVENGEVDDKGEGE